jgi:ADP-ribose pyrophosphatase YjhB (NUDIX family)
MEIFMCLRPMARLAQAVQLRRCASSGPHVTGVSKHPTTNALHAAVYVILRQPLSACSKSILMMRRQGGWGAGQWSLPSGHIEIDLLETPTRAAVREVLEEVGVEVSEQSLKVVHVMYVRT